MHRHLCRATGIKENQGEMIPLKEYSKPPPHGPKEMETQELPNKRFKINVLKILRELQENISKQ